MSAVPTPWSAMGMSNEIPFDALPADCTWGREMRLDGARADLAEARAALAAAVREQDPDRHFRGLPESPDVIAAYDAVRDAEKAVAKLERDGRRRVAEDDVLWAFHLAVDGDPTPAQVDEWTARHPAHRDAIAERAVDIIDMRARMASGEVTR